MRVYLTPAQVRDLTAAAQWALDSDDEGVYRTAATAERVIEATKRLKSARRWSGIPNETGQELKP